jgi:pyridoxine 4-dehydrogenase
MPSPPPPGGLARLGERAVARIGYGAMQLETAAEDPDRRPGAIALLRRALELGVTHLDTAGFYGDQVVNRLIREALAPYPEDLVIVSKVGAARVSGATPPLVPAQRPEQLRAAVDADRRALGVERIDVVNLRRVDRRPGIRAIGDQVVDLDDQLAALVALRDEGAIGAIGLSHVTAEQLERALPAGIVCVQNAYSLVGREDEPLLARCRDAGIAWVPFFPLGGAFAGWPKVADVPAVLAAARMRATSPAAIGLAWLLAHAPNILLIPGTSSPDHLAENVTAGALELDPATVAALDAAAPPADPGPA